MLLPLISGMKAAKANLESLSKETRSSSISHIPFSVYTEKNSKLPHLWGKRDEEESWQSLQKKFKTSPTTPTYPSSDFFSKKRAKMWKKAAFESLLFFAKGCQCNFRHDTMEPHSLPISHFDSLKALKRMIYEKKFTTVILQFVNFMLH